MLAKLAEPRVLWLSFSATVLITIAFQIIVRQFDLVLLDSIAIPAQVNAAISGMSEFQRHLHAWLTGTLDVAYPIAYGALFAGSAYRFFPSSGRLLAIPALVCVPVDLVEGVVQILALTSGIDWTVSKVILTPLKQLLFVVGFLITLAGWLNYSLVRMRVGT